MKKQKYTDYHDQFNLIHTYCCTLIAFNAWKTKSKFCCLIEFILSSLTTLSSECKILATVVFCILLTIKLHFHIPSSYAAVMQIADARRVSDKEFFFIASHYNELLNCNCKLEQNNNLVSTVQLKIAV